MFKKKFWNAKKIELFVFVSDVDNGINLYDRGHCPREIHRRSLPSSLQSCEFFAFAVWVFYNYFNHFFVLNLFIFTRYNHLCSFSRIKSFSFNNCFNSFDCHFKLSKTFLTVISVYLIFYLLLSYPLQSCGFFIAEKQI